MQKLIDSAFAKIDAAGVDARKITARWSVQTITPKEKVALLLNDLGTEIRRDGITHWVKKGYADKKRGGYNHQRIIAAILNRYRYLDEEFYSLLVELMRAVEDTTLSKGVLPQELQSYEWIPLSLLDGYTERFWSFIENIIDEYDNTVDPLVLKVQWPAVRVEIEKPDMGEGIRYPQITVGITKTDLPINISQSNHLSDVVMICSTILRALWAAGVSLSEINKFNDGYWEASNQDHAALTKFYAEWVDVDGHLQTTGKKINEQWLTGKTEWSAGRLIYLFLLKSQSKTNPDGIIITTPDIGIIQNQLKEYSTPSTIIDEGFERKGANHVFIMDEYNIGLDDLFELAKRKNAIVIRGISEDDRMDIASHASSHGVSFVNLYSDEWD